MKRADHHLIQQVLDGDVTRETFDAFQERLRKEPELLGLYENYALLHHTLSEEFEGAQLAEQEPSDARRRSFRLPVVIIAVAAVACLAAVWLHQVWNTVDEIPDVAVVTFSLDAVWKIDGPTRPLGGATGVSRNGIIHLQQGRASITLEPLVRAVIEGPAEVAVLSANSLHMTHGRGYFQCGGMGSKLTVTTPRLTSVDSGTAYEIDTPADGPDVVRVMEGKLQIISKATQEIVLLNTGGAARIPTNGPVEPFPSGGGQIATSLGRFHGILQGPFTKFPWRKDYGNPSISEQRIEGMNYSLMLSLPARPAGLGSSVVLATLDVGRTSSGEFHTGGWAGMSFFSKGREVVFFGDSFGTRPVWSLDVKQGVPVILPEHPVSGPQVVTLRYDRRTGGVSLHEGGPPLKAPFCSGKIPPDVSFDEIRIGASSGAALTVKSLVIRVSED